MNTSDPLHVVLGANGGAGSYVVKELLARGKRVRGVSRNPNASMPEGVESIVADLNQIDQARIAVEGAGCVYHCAQPAYHRWAEEFPALNETILAAMRGSNARLVFCDNLYMYGPTQEPMREDMPYRPNSKKGRVRAALAERLMQAHERGDVAVCIGRASDYYGPGMLNTAFGGMIFANAVKGKAANVIGDTDQPHTITYIEDLARGLVVLGEREAATGQVWHLPSADTVSVREFLEIVYREAGFELKVRSLSGPLLTVLGLFITDLREIKDIRYQFEAPFVMDDSKFRAAFGPVETIGHEEGIRSTLRWFQKTASGA